MAVDKHITASGSCRRCGHRGGHRGQHIKACRYYRPPTPPAPPKIRPANYVQPQQKRSPEHIAWRDMIARCYNQKNKCYYRYGGRGIRVCERWRESFFNFLADMGPRPGQAYSLDRFPDNNGDYCPENCRWATWDEQHANMRTNRLVTLNGETMPAFLWAKRLDMDIETFRARLKRGWDYQQIATKPYRKASDRVSADDTPAAVVYVKYSPPKD